jgi:4'-phosphopantetheinyl transferase EntD
MPVVNDQGHRALDAGQAHFLDGRVMAHVALLEPTQGQFAGHES